MGDELLDSDGLLSTIFVDPGMVMKSKLAANYRKYERYKSFKARDVRKEKEASVLVKHTAGFI